MQIVATRKLRPYNLGSKLPESLETLFTLKLLHGKVIEGRLARI
jgi:hypothetical protein